MHKQGAGRHHFCRVQRQAKQVVVSDSQSEGLSDNSDDAASDFHSSEESQQSLSEASSLDASDEEDSPPPAKRGRKVCTHEVMSAYSWYAILRACVPAHLTLVLLQQRG